ncbi:hypothetical protein MMO39_04815 [Acinetobacter modestus]|uniref:hypothetical protein n=1 Tax=Acinetobacter modestus TaxID=1776740 RepID=UPI001F4BBFF7|nr:hypothetical protein [Acinetobacter modestus]MCH7386623.1 hypothetical protein [Acinetobacter modestus]
MNDFFLLNNESLPYKFIDQNIEIKQIQVKNLSRFAQFADPIKNLESYSVETITPLIVINMIQIMGVLSLTTSINADYFIQQLGNTSAIAELILKVIDVNEAIFKKEASLHRQDQQETESASWFNSIQYLISAGHRPDDILNMPYGAFLKYIEAAQRNERQNIKNTAVAVRMAMNSSKQEWDKSIKQLEK